MRIHADPDPRHCFKKRRKKLLKFFSPAKSFLGPRRAQISYLHHCQIYRIPPALKYEDCCENKLTVRQILLPQPQIGGKPAMQGRLDFALVIQSYSTAQTTRKTSVFNKNSRGGKETVTPSLIIRRRISGGGFVGCSVQVHVHLLNIASFLKCRRPAVFFYVFQCVLGCQG